MRGGLAIGLVACGMTAAGCGVQIEGGQPTPDGRPTTDGPVVVVDAPPDAAQLGPWGAPKLVPGAGTALGEDDGSLSSNASELVFSIQDPNAGNTKDLWYMSRTSSAAAWSAPVK